MTYRLPGPDFGGFTSFEFQLVADEKGAPLILSNEVIELYLAYCVQCKTESKEASNFSGWLSVDSDPALYASEEAAAASADEDASGEIPLSGS